MPGCGLRYRSSQNLLPVLPLIPLPIFSCRTISYSFRRASLRVGSTLFLLSRCANTCRRRHALVTQSQASDLWPCAQLGAAHLSHTSSSVILETYFFLIRNFYLLVVYFVFISRSTRELIHSSSSYLRASHLLCSARPTPYSRLFCCCCNIALICTTPLSPLL